MSKKFKKIIPYLLILIILVGLFSPLALAHAQTSAFQNSIDNSCNGLWTFTFKGCLEKLVYYVIVVLPSFALYISAQFFNYIISLAIQSSITSSSTFISTAWAVVRDLSNIFFILVLLYIAIETIMGLGHETKKMIAHVVIMALLINFSMFFTKVVIDSSNILALVFYNKLDTRQSNTDATPATTPGEKDISGALYKNFNATNLVNQTTLDALRTTPGIAGGSPVTTDTLPLGITLGFMAIAGTVMIYTAYILFIAGISFLGRLIELWVLIIFSPFAFMSWTVPQLAGVEYLGWKAWLHRLIATSFMAPIFMFFMYLIFKLLGANILGGMVQGQGAIVTILKILIPALIILALLKKATEFAKKGGGEFGAAVMKYGGMAAGLAVTGAALATGVGGAALVGRAAASAASSGALQNKAKQKGFGGAVARLGLKTANYGSKASFDVRAIPGVGSLAKAGGLNLGKAGGEGGYMKARADKVKKRQERVEQLGKVKEDEKIKQDLNKTQEDLQGLLSQYAKEIEGIDKTIEKKRQEVGDANNRLNAAKGTAGEAAAQNALQAATTSLDDAKNNRTNFREGRRYINSAGQADFAVTASNDSIDSLEKQEKEQKQIIKNEVRERSWAAADRIEGKGSKVMFWRKTRTNKEAAHKVRMETKLDSGDKH